MPGANGASDGAGGKHAWRTWQSDDDIPQRKILIQHMCVAKANGARGDAGTARRERGSRGRGLGREDARERAHKAKGRLTTAWTRERCADCECLNKGNRN